MIIPTINIPNIKLAEKKQSGKIIINTMIDGKSVSIELSSRLQDFFFNPANYDSNKTEEENLTSMANYYLAQKDNIRYRSETVEGQYKEGDIYLI